MSWVHVSQGNSSQLLVPGPPDSDDISRVVGSKVKVRSDGHRNLVNSTLDSSWTTEGGIWTTTYTNTYYSPATNWWGFGGHEFKGQDHRSVLWRRHTGRRFIVEGHQDLGLVFFVCFLLVVMSFCRYLQCSELVDEVVRWVPRSTQLPVTRSCCIIISSHTFTGTCYRFLAGCRRRRLNHSCSFRFFLVVR